MIQRKKMYFPLVAELNPPNIPLMCTHFWAYLERTQESHRLLAFRNYFKDLGFNKADYRLGHQEIDTLRAVMSYFWYLKLKKQ